MKIVNFLEGTHAGVGGVGLIGAFFTCRALAERGHDVVAHVAGPVAPGFEPHVVAGVTAGQRGRQRPTFRPRFRIVSYRAFGRWAFAPGLAARAATASDADFVLLHSLYSFPVAAGYAASRLDGTPYAQYLHGVLAPFQRSVSARKKAVYDRLIGRRILDDAAFLVFTDR